MRNHNTTPHQAAKQAGFTTPVGQRWYSLATDKLRPTRFTRTSLRSAGFTIVELMIATMVFSTILVVITVGVLSFTSAYYKGVNSSTTQDTARSVMDTISQAVQFSGYNIVQTAIDNGNGGTGLSFFCVNGQTFTYRPGAQYGGGTATKVSPGLYVTSSSTCAPSVAGGTQLLGPHMRIATLQLVPDASLSQAYSVSIRLIYSSGGDSAHDGDDLLCSPGIASGVGSCNAGSGNLSLDNYTTPAIASTVVCRLQTGSQFCAVSALATTVIKRVDNAN